MIYICHTHTISISLQKEKELIMNRIKEVIKERGFTITSLAEKLGIARESLSRMIVSPSYPTLEKIASALDVPMWQFFASPDEAAKELSGDKCPYCGNPLRIKIEKGE